MQSQNQLKNIEIHESATENPKMDISLSLNDVAEKYQAIFQDYNRLLQDIQRRRKKKSPFENNLTLLLSEFNKIEESLRRLAGLSVELDKIENYKEISSLFLNLCHACEKEFINPLKKQLEEIKIEVSKEIMLSLHDKIIKLSEQIDEVLDEEWSEDNKNYILDRVKEINNHVVLLNNQNIEEYFTDKLNNLINQVNIKDKKNLIYLKYKVNLELVDISNRLSQLNYVYSLTDDDQFLENNAGLTKAIGQIFNEIILLEEYIQDKNLELTVDCSRLISQTKQLNENIEARLEVVFKENQARFLKLKHIKSTLNEQKTHWELFNSDIKKLVDTYSQIIIKLEKSPKSPQPDASAIIDELKQIVIKMQGNIDAMEGKNFILPQSLSMADQLIGANDDKFKSLSKSHENYKQDFNELEEKFYELVKEKKLKQDETDESPIISQPKKLKLAINHEFIENLADEKQDVELVENILVPANTSEISVQNAMSLDQELACSNDENFEEQNCINLANIKSLADELQEIAEIEEGVQLAKVDPAEIIIEEKQEKILDVDEDTILDAEISIPAPAKQSEPDINGIYDANKNSFFDTKHHFSHITNFDLPKEEITSPNHSKKVIDPTRLIINTEQKPINKLQVVKTLDQLLKELKEQREKTGVKKFVRKCKNFILKIISPKRTKRKEKEFKIFTDLLAQAANPYTEQQSVQAVMNKWFSANDGKSKKIINAKRGFSLFSRKKPTSSMKALERFKNKNSDIYIQKNKI